jgi:hypothetical protein
MKQKLDAYTLFNFFVTCYHIADYVRADNIKLEAALNAMYADEDFQLVRFLCNRGKHLELKPANDREHYELLMGARSGIARSGAFRSGEPVRWHLYVDDRRVEPIALGETILEKWKQFFDANGVAR